MSKTERKQPPRLKSLDWYPDPLTRGEKVMLAIGWLTAFFGLGVVIWSFF
jgi:hypothetical protein